MSRRRYVLIALLAALGVIGLLILSRVFATVFFAITVAYVLLPADRWLMARGVSRRISAALVTLFAFAAALAVIAPIGFVLYRRRGVLIDLIRSIPEEVVLSGFGFEYTLRTVDLLATAQEAVQTIAVSLASAAPIVALKLVLFTLIVYAVVLSPGEIRRAVFRLVPPEYRDIVEAFHRRTRRTLFAIYVLQALTGVATFAVAMAVFFGLGYEAWITLAVIAGILQFIPVVGPSILVILLAAYDFAVLGDPTRGALVLVLGLVLVGFLPDAIVRPQLAELTADLRPSLYFIGFTGGVLSLGLVGFIAGPLVISLLVEAFSLLAADLGLTPDESKD